MIMEAKIQLFNAENIDSLIWPETDEGQFAKKMLYPLVKEGVEPYFENVKTKVNVISFNGLVLPITINDKEQNNAYVCSFYSYYIGSGLQYASSLKSRIFRTSVKGVLKGLGFFFRLGEIDKVVSVNNWLFSTNLYPPLNSNQVLTIRIFLEKTYPKHGIVFRSINTIDQNSPISSLKSHQFDLIASRQIFITDTKKEQVFNSRLFKSDLKVLDETKYSLGNLDQYNEESLPKILSLYNALYVDKYSGTSPRLNCSFLKLILDNNLFKFKTLNEDGRIDGVVGFYSMYGVMMSPFFGYDTSLSQKLNLYRLLSTILTLEAKDSGHLFHQSSGASFYKTIRKATPSIEYNAVYVNHLSFRQKMCWKILKTMINNFGVSMMEKY